uniref:Kinase suppressor of ras 1b n=1 Tax=Seriola lalandi dorsalis TaxID=1841481 RepID=A0A3B4WJ05_SERLL
MDRGAGRGDRGVRGGRTKPGGAEEALRQCRLIQNLVDISTSSLQALRTRCTATNDLTQQEIRTLEVKLTEYMWTQLQWKQRVPERERPAALSGYPRLENWLLTPVTRRPPCLLQAAAGKLSVDRLLQMSSSELQDTMRRLGSNSEDCSRLTAALSCLKSADETGSQQDSDAPSPISAPSSAGSPSTPLPPTSSRSPSVSISVAPCSDDQRPADGTTDIFAVEPSAQTSKTRTAKPSHTPPPPSRKLLQLLPNIALTRSKSQESQLANRIEEPAAHSSPQTMRRDIGLAVTHRFSTKSWLSQTCQVCHKSMMFGVKCKHCKLKCHNKCTKDAPSCRISFLTLPRMRRAESVPSDINNRIDHTAEIPQQYGTLPKAITKREPPITLNQMDSSSNPSSATSSTPSSPAHFQQSNPPSVSTTPPPNASPRGSRDNRFHFPGQQPHHVHRAVSSPAEVVLEDYPAEDEEAADRRSSKKSFPTEECDEDGLEDLPSSICRRGAAGRWKGQISRKASQTSVYLQEWDIPYEQLQLGELIGKGRWGKVHKGRWHGEVAIRLMEVDGNNQDHLKLFKKEVMNYRQTRHENVVLFMGACMAPPHLAIITRYSCKNNPCPVLRLIFNIVHVIPRDIPVTDGQYFVCFQLL